MANKPLGKRMQKEILRLNRLGFSKSRIASILGISRNTVRKYLRADIEGENDIDFTLDNRYVPIWAEWIDWNNVKSAIDRGVALSVWWEENIKPVQQGDLAGLPFVTFWREWRRRYPKIDLAYHKNHPPAERMEIDFKGDSEGLGFVDAETNTFQQCKLFGSVLCFSQMFFAKASLDEKRMSLFSGAASSFEYFGGVPDCMVFDNAKTAVDRADWYDPDINPEYANFCEHYQTAPIATRPRKPKDKNLIENHLGLFWRWAGPKIRLEKFYSLGELNAFIIDLCNKFNSRIQRKYGLSREEKFINGERDKLNKLPEMPYECGVWKRAKVHPDCHIQIQYNFYSAPYGLRGKEVEVRVSSCYVEIFYNLERVAIHQLYPSQSRGAYRSDPKHLPESHKAMLEFTPKKILQDAEKIGPQTGILVKRLLEKARHPLMHLRKAQGIVRLSKRNKCADLELASKKLNDIGVKFPKIRQIEGVIKYLNQPDPSKNKVKRGTNLNLRGQKYWQSNQQTQGESNDEHVESHESVSGRAKARGFSGTG